MQVVVLQNLFLALALSLVAPAAVSQSAGGEFAIQSQTIDSGGGVCSGGVFALTGTIGQPDAAQPTSGGIFGLRGGFWRSIGPAIEPMEQLFSDSFETLFALASKTGASPLNHLRTSND